MNIWVVMVICAVASFSIIMLFYFLGRRKDKSQKPINRSVAGQNNSNKIGDKSIRVDRNKVGSRDNETDIRSIIRQELQQMNGTEPEVEPAEVVEPEKIPVETYSKIGDINAEIVNPAHRTIGFYHVDMLPGKDYGRQWLIQAKSVFSLRIGKDGSLEPMDHNTLMDHPTSEAYEAIQTKDDMVEVFGNHDEGDNKLKIGMLVLAACVALFLMFMAIYKGGK